MVPLLNLTLFSADPTNRSDENETTSFTVDFHVAHTFFFLLIFMVVLGNLVVLLAVLVDRKLRTVTTNKFIASLAVSDLLVGLVVMPLSLHAKMHGDLWILGHTWCQFHLVTGVFSTTASIVHLVAISLDRYFAIMFPTEYQRHSVSTSTTPYVVMIWLMAFCVSSSLFMEQNPVNERICWIDNPQYLVLSSLLSFFLPGIIVVYMYVKIFQKLRNHQLYMFGQQSTRQPDHKRSLPRVIIEEVRSRRGSRLSQTGSSGGSPTRRSSGPKSERSPSQPEIHTVALPPQRWRSPTICAETFEHDRSVAAKKRVSIVPDPPSMDISSTSNIGALRAEHETAIQREKMEAELKLLQDEPRFRKFSDKCCERREREKLEKRRNSSDGRPNGVPIMLAFNKAYSEIRAGRRRASLGREDSEGELHLPLRFQLSTVYADEEENPEDTALNPNSIELTEIEKTATTAETSLVKDESMQESLSTDASLRPLLSLTTLNQPSKLETITLKTNNSSNRTTPRCLLNRLRFAENLPTKHGNFPSIFRNHNRIPAPTFLMVPAVMSINTSALPQHNTEYQHSGSLQVPRLFDCPSPSSAPSNSSHSSYTSASGSSDTYRRISMNSYGSSLTDATDSTFEIDSRRSSAWSTLRSAVLSNDFKNFPNCARPSVEIAVDGVGYSKKSNGISRGKLRRIATQVTRAIRRKRRESMAIRRESRATRVVAAILMAFIICWLPYFCISVYRGISMGFRVNIHRELHTELYVATSWLGYAHSCFNPVIYMCLNKNFRVTLRRMLRITRDQ